MLSSLELLVALIASLWRSLPGKAASTGKHSRKMERRKLWWHHLPAVSAMSVAIPQHCISVYMRQWRLLSAYAGLSCIPVPCSLQGATLQPEPGTRAARGAMRVNETVNIHAASKTREKAETRVSVKKANFALKTQVQNRCVVYYMCYLWLLPTVKWP